MQSVDTLPEDKRAEYLEGMRRLHREFLKSLFAPCIYLVSGVCCIVILLMHWPSGVRGLLQGIYGVEAWGFILTIQASGLLLWLFARYAFKRSES